MKSVAEFVLLNAVFIAMNLLGAGILLGLFKAGQAISPALMEQPLFTYPLGLAGIALTLWLSFRGMRFIVRVPRPYRARGPG